MSLNAGALLADRYRLGGLIAVGGMGEVWEATDTRLHRKVALKVLKPEVSADPEFLERFRVEARTSAQLNHPGIAGVYDYGETQTLDDGDRHTAYLVMELVDGEPLSAVLAREGRLDLEQTMDMLEQTARALQAAHARGIVHRDVKPGNILITPAGEVKITDFGIAKAADAAPVTRTGMVVGTAQYIAPEQALGLTATPASDVYALGVVGHEAVSGARPFTGESPLSVAMQHVREEPPPLPPEVPATIRRLLGWSMAKDPAQRYATGGEFADAIAAVRAGREPLRPAGLAGGATSAMPPTRTQRMVPPAVPAPVPMPVRTAYDDTPRRRHRSNAALLWFLGILAIGLLALGAYALLSSRQATPTPIPATSTTQPAPTPTTTAARTTTTTTRTPEVTTTTSPPAPTTTTTVVPPPTTVAPTTTQAPAPTTTRSPTPTTTSRPAPTTAPGSPGATPARTTGGPPTTTGSAPS